MKKFFALFAFVACATIAFAQGGPVMTLDLTEMDYGTIDKGGDPLRIFTFKNTGTEPLLITAAKGSCGCTVPSYPKEAIMPGEAASIEVRYDTQRVGPFTKTITLTTNESAQTRVLTIRGTVNDVAPAVSVPTSAPAILAVPTEGPSPKG
jgi:Protein of unknown function (DUF1573)